MSEGLEARIESYLKQLCADVDDRHVGGPGNRSSTAMFARVCRELGYEVETVELDCLEWDAGECELRAGGRGFLVLPGPYSLPFDGSAVLAEASSVEQLEAGGFEGAVLLLHGDLVSEQLIPKNFPYYSPAPHQRIIRALEAGRPAAVVAATGMNPGLAGGSYPFPLLEDGDFDIPNAYMTDIDGEELLRSAGTEVTLRIASKRRAAVAEQPIARKAGTDSGRILLLAHIDSKNGTPGALDNATGVASLLGAAELLAEYAGGPSIELWPFNGEDYYAVTGQRYFMERNADALGDVVLGLNVDGAGHVNDGTAVSLYGVEGRVADTVLEVAARHGIVEGPQWPQGDHSILAMNGVPAIALTSENAFFIASTVAHTPQDTIDKVDVAAVAQVARYLAATVEALGLLER